MQKVATARSVMKFLHLLVIIPGLDQGNEGIGDHVGVDAQVVFVVEILEQGIGHVAIADLQGAAVVDQFLDVLGDAPGVVSSIGSRYP
jgi:hypothetical protein